MFRERVIEFVTDLPKSPRDMAERLKKVPLWYKAASMIIGASLATCQLGKRFGSVTPPPEGTKTPPTETVPPTETPTPFIEPGWILDLEKDQGLLSPEIKKEFEDFDALHPELEGRDVYKFAIQSPIGQIGFATHEVKPEEIETAIIAQTKDGKTAVTIPDRTLYVTAKDAASGEYSWSRLLGVATPGATENTKIISWFYLSEGYPKAEETTLLNLDYPVLAYQMPNNGEFLFWYPVMVDGKPTWSSDYQMAVVSRYESLPEGARKVLFSLLPVEPTSTPEFPPLPQEFLSQIPADKQYEIANGQVLVDGQVWFEMNSAGEWQDKRPLYWQCGPQIYLNNTRTVVEEARILPTGLQSQGEFTNLTYLREVSARTCLTKVNNVPDPLFPDAAIRGKVIFFDLDGKAHEYSIMMGAVDNSGREMGLDIGVVIPDGVMYRSVPIKEALQMLEDFYNDSDDKASRQIDIDFATEDRGAPWILGEYINPNRELLVQLIEALKTGRGFPENVPEDFFLWVSQVAPIG